MGLAHNPFILCRGFLRGNVELVSALTMCIRDAASRNKKMAFTLGSGPRRLAWESCHLVMDNDGQGFVTQCSRTIMRNILGQMPQPGTPREDRDSRACGLSRGVELIVYGPFYGLREPPFELTPNPEYLYLTANHREVLCNLQYGIAAQRGITLLIGEAGTGKTTLVHAALNLVRQAQAFCVYLNNPTLTRAEFVEFLANAFGLGQDARKSKAIFLTELEQTLRSRQKSGIVSALLIDEAQSLPTELLEEIRLLVNMETATAKLLQVVLAGQQELAGRLNEPSLRQLKQRVALRCDLSPLNLHETRRLHRVTPAQGWRQRRRHLHS